MPTILTDLCPLQITMPSRWKGIASVQLLPIEAAFEFQLHGHEDGIHLGGSVKNRKSSPETIGFPLKFRGSNVFLKPNPWRLN